MEDISLTLIERVRRAMDQEDKRTGELILGGLGDWDQYQLMRGRLDGLKRARSIFDDEVRKIEAREKL